MKKLTTLLMLALLAFSFAACKDDDNTTTEPIIPEEAIVGVWISEGSNIATLLLGPPFNIRKITATFNANGSYEVVQVDSVNASLTLSGTYSVAKSTVGEIYTITANQQSPSVLTSEGIYEITGTSMKYEIVQTSPAIGFAPPTPADGFGSTGGGAFGTMNVQTYVKQ